MKKLLALLLSLTMVFLVACSGGDKELGTAKLEQGQVSYTIKYFGNGDKVNKMEQTTVAKDLTDEQINRAKAELPKLEEKYKSIKGTEYTSDLKDKTLTEKLIMDVGNKETLKTLIDQDLLVVTNKNAEKISLEQSLNGLKSAGWTTEKAK